MKNILLAVLILSGFLTGVAGVIFAQPVPTPAPARIFPELTKPVVRPIALLPDDRQDLVEALWAQSLVYQTAALRADRAGDKARGDNFAGTAYGLQNAAYLVSNYLPQ